MTCADTGQCDRISHEVDPGPARVNVTLLRASGDFLHSRFRARPAKLKGVARGPQWLVWTGCLCLDTGGLNEHPTT